MPVLNCKDEMRDVVKMNFMSRRRRLDAMRLVLSRKAKSDVAIEESYLVKKAFKDHYEARFKSGCRLSGYECLHDEIDFGCVAI
ncbi:hypothetical protein Tco_0732545 [Tanacetum coccineum]